MSDNWKHRSQHMRCKTCMWFAPKVRTDSLPAEQVTAGATEGGLTQRTVFGRCRRRAPTMNGFPAVFGTDWCGDHKLDEEAV